MTKGSIGFHSLQVCPKVRPRLSRPQAAQKGVVDETVLSGDFCRGVLGDAGADGFRLGYHTADAGFLQKVRAQYPCHAAADDQHIRADVPFQRNKMGGFGSFCPNGCHMINSFFP